MNNPKTYLINSFAIGLLFTAVSCVTSDQEDLAPIDSKTISSEEISEMMGLMEEVDLMVMSTMQQDLSQQRLIPLLDELSCPGTIITRDDKIGQVKVDFGSGCISDSGLERAGNLKITYSGGILSKGSLLTIDFEDFSLNGHKMNGQRKLENLGYDASTRTLSFSSSVSNFKMTNLNGHEFNLDQSYIKELELSTANEGFRIYLKGNGSLTAQDYGKTTFEIVQPLKYMQQCIESGSYDPIEGSLQISTDTYKNKIVSFESLGCS